MKSPRKPRLVASFDDKLAIYERLKEVLSPVPGTEFWAYAEGLSDTAIAQEIGSVNARHVENIRLTKFGPMQPPVAEAAVPSAEQLQEIIVREVRELRAEIMSETDKRIHARVKPLSDVVEGLSDTIAEIRKGLVLVQDDFKGLNRQVKQTLNESTVGQMKGRVDALAVQVRTATDKVNKIARDLGA
jgi:hypothetical protein